MCKNYSRGNTGRSDYIEAEILPLILAKNSEIILERWDVNLIKSFCYCILKWVDLVLKKTLLELTTFCQNIISIIDHTKPVTLTSCEKPFFSYSKPSFMEKLKLQEIILEIKKRKP